MLLVRACGAETFVPWTLLERAGASCLLMLELNFHSGSSITQMRLTSRSDCYRAGALGGFSQMFERWMMSQFDRMLRGSKTFGLAMLLVQVCGAETFVPWTLLERAGASCLFMLELNFHSGSSISQVRLTSRSDCYRTGALGGFSQMFERWMMSQFDRLLSVDHFRDVSVRTADIETLGAIYIDCGVPVMLGGPIGSETRQRWSCVLRYHSWDGLTYQEPKRFMSLLGNLLVSYCVPLLSMERQMALGLWSRQSCYGGYTKRMLAL
ncbi:hypothetical protein F2Q70_00018156 [Brassica cretica]|uniref:Uncharacterized protein n=1 Tax=Brassica cretica TaxID=69181 RepID=A0A8S9HRK0_BRACR|nr:hypothetical protein F2Q70_00018156 [Brassica cretica]